MTFGSSGAAKFGEVTKEEAFAIMDTFYTNGGSFFDTANGYQDGESEEWVGEWMAEHKSMKLSLDASLAKLKTSYVNILYVHWWDYSTSIPELMHSLDDLVTNGKVLYLSVSDSPAWGMWNASMRDFGRDIIPMVHAEGMGLAPYGVLNQGRFQTKAAFEAREKESPGRKFIPTSTRDKEVSAVLETVADRKKCELVQVALAYCLQKTPYVFPIVGGRTVRHIQGSIEGLAVVLNKDEVADIGKAYPIDHGFPHTFLSGSLFEGLDAEQRMADGPDDVVLTKWAATLHPRNQLQPQEAFVLVIPSSAQRLPGEVIRRIFDHVWAPHTLGVLPHALKTPLAFARLSTYHSVVRDFLAASSCCRLWRGAVDWIALIIAVFDFSSRIKTPRILSTKTPSYTRESIVREFGNIAAPHFTTHPLDGNYTVTRPPPDRQARDGMTTLLVQGEANPVPEPRIERFRTLRRPNLLGCWAANIFYDKEAYGWLSDLQASSRANLSEGSVSTKLSMTLVPPDTVASSLFCTLALLHEMAYLSTPNGRDRPMATYGHAHAQDVYDDNYAGHFAPFLLPPSDSFPELQWPTKVPVRAGDTSPSLPPEVFHCAIPCFEGLRTLVATMVMVHL
ncbi:hypothetical protein HKX48_005929 [Thoreauomyces humboldtii]|nr:hypothetical protein HKX48_005929 [Thoreauomyces humboldtii]